jgi:HEAT repeat protein
MKPISASLAGFLLAAGLAMAPTIAAAPPPAGTRVSDLAEALAGYESGASAAPLREIEDAMRQNLTEPRLRRELEAALVRVLEGKSTYEARQFASRQLAILGSENSVAALVGLLRVPDMVELGCLALGIHPSPRAEQALLRALPGLTGSSRLQVVQILGDRRVEAAVPSLIAITRNPDRTEALAAVVALGKIGNEPARRHLVTLHKAEDAAMVSAVIEAFLRMAEKHVLEGSPREAKRIYEDLSRPGQPDHVRRGACGALLSLDRDGGEQRIRSTLRSDDSLLRPLAIAAVAGLKSSGISRKSGREMPRLSSQEKVWMIEALAARADRGALEVIAEHVAAPEPTVHLAAIDALGHLGDASTVPLLCGALAGTGDAQVGAAAERALVELNGGQQTDRAIMQEQRRAAAHLKPRLITVLGKRGSPTALPLLLEETRSADLPVARAAFQALGRLAGAKEAPLLVEVLSNLNLAELRTDAEAAVIQVLHRMPEPSARSTIVRTQLSQTTHPAGRASLVRLLPACADGEAMKTLLVESEHPDLQVRDAAVRALADWPDLTAWGGLLAWYRQDPNESHRVLALRGLVRLVGEENSRPDDAQAERYRQLMASAKNDDDRRLILGAMAGCAHPDVLRLALSLVAQTGVRAEAVSAVKTLAELIKSQHPQLAAEALKAIQ